MRCSLAAVFLALAVCGSATIALADEPTAAAETRAPDEAPSAATRRGPPPPHSGVMWRLTLGGAYLHAWSQAGGMSRTASAFPAFAFAVSLGHAIADNLVLHLDVTAARTGSATYSSEGETIDDIALTATMMGAGLTYWITPLDFYVTGGVGLGQISTVSGAYRVVIEIPNIESTGIGIGFWTSVGKQWRVGRKWGVGPALRFWFLTAPQDFSEADHQKLVAIDLSLGVTFD